METAGSRRSENERERPLDLTPMLVLDGRVELSVRKQKSSDAVVGVVITQHHEIGVQLPGSAPLLARDQRFGSVAGIAPPGTG